MSIEITDNPSSEDEAFVISQTRSYNAAFTTRDIRPLGVFIRNEHGAIVGGLTGKTYWRYLDVAYLWVDKEHRRRGLGTKLMTAALEEARQRGCSHALLDTYSFQALGFYQKLGFHEFGRLEGFSDNHHTRHYLCKDL